MLEALGSTIINIISSTGYLGVFLLMTVESALIPVPSEVTMPFSGSLIALGKFNLILLGIVGALGNLAGSLLAYGLGYWGQENVVRTIIKKYGKFLLISEHEFDRAKNWFVRYGDLIVLLSRVMPVLRTFISLPAGIAKMNLTKFIIYTTVGSFIWSIALAYVGMVLGKRWDSLSVYFHKFDLVIVLALGFLVIFYVYYHLKKIRQKA